MIALPFVLTCLIAVAPLHAEQAPAGGAAEAQAMLDEALKLAQSIPDAAVRADAVGRVAAEIARTDPRRALKLVSKEMATHEQSEAMARSAERLAQDNRVLGLATLIRIADKSSLLRALGRIVAMEALTDFDDAVDICSKIDTLTVRWDTQREVSRVVWEELPGDKATAVAVAVRWADQITDPVTRDEALAYAAEGAGLYQGAAAAAAIGEHISAAGDARDLAWRLAVQAIGARDPLAAEALLPRIGTVFQRNLAAATVVRGLAAAGKREEALRLANDIRKQVEQQIEDPRDQSSILGETALGIMELDSHEALSLLSEVYPPVRRYSLQCRVAEVVGRSDPEAARELLLDAWVEVRRSDDPLMRQQLAAEAIATAAQVAPEFLATMTQEAPELVQQALPEAVLIVAQQHPETALKMADQIADPAAADSTRAAVAAALAASKPELARTVLAKVSAPAARSGLLVALAATMRGIGVD